MNMGSTLFFIGPDDLSYEQNVIRDSRSIKPWLLYAEYKAHHGSEKARAFVLERACIALPRSYKLWRIYLRLRTQHLSTKNSALHIAEYAKVNALFEHALVLLNKMPRIWTMYLTFLMQQPLVTKTRHTFDRALRALPITQHKLLWKLYPSFARTASGDTAIRIWQRFTQTYPQNVPELIEIYEEQGKYMQAITCYIHLLDSPAVINNSAKSGFQLWNAMTDLMVIHAKEIKNAPYEGLDVAKIIRSGIERFSDQRGKLWTRLCSFFISLGMFEKARDTFEEAITTALTVRDFTIVFDSYVEFEESLIGSLMSQANARVRNKVLDENADHDLDIHLMRFEQLMDRRPFLINDVLIRQNANNVNEWEKRITLWGDNKAEVVNTYMDAIKSIQPRKALGRLHDLWLNYARLYDDENDRSTARTILERAIQVPYRTVAELVEIWCGWVQMELRHNDIDKALEVIARATQAPKRSNVQYFDETLMPQQRVHKSWKLWSLYADLIESVGTISATKKVYERIFELRIATPQTVVNYANFLEQHSYFEDSFRVYERGLDLFKYPVAFELWNLYLTKAMDRKISIERLRDLFEQAIESCPAKLAKSLYLLYAQLEDERGLARHAMRIYERATRGVAAHDRYEMFQYYIAKSTSNFGLTSTRPIYQRAIEVLPDKEAKEMCIAFAEMERRLGEIDRARAILGHGSQFSDPRITPTYWQKWEAFEIQHGNEDTFREMLRIKRSVQAQYNTDVNFIASQALIRSQKSDRVSESDIGDVNATNDVLIKGDAMGSLDAKRGPTRFVSASSNPSVAVLPSGPENPEALAIDLDDE